MKPEDFIIKRKRKKYKFAKFTQLANCFQSAEFDARRRDDFTAGKRIVLELGAGSALFSVEMAARQSEKRFVAIDVKADRLVKGAEAAEERGIANIVFVRAHANQLLEMFAPRSLDEIWLTFPDPFPKKRHAKHRMTHPDFLRQYRELLSHGGILHFKTDDHYLFCWSLEQFVAEKLVLSNLSFDLHSSGLPEDYKIMTTYEKRFAAQGLPVYHTDVVFSD